MPLNASQPGKKTVNKKIIKLDKQVETKKIGIETNSPSSLKYNTEELIFALDIGTRSVIGIVGVQKNEKFKVITAEVMEHKSRAMLDGQIHDISQVAAIARELKEKLEKNIGMTLSRVAIAAAGRVLKTCRIKTERVLDQGREIDQKLLSSLEMEAIQQAQARLDAETAQEEKTQFYCVGYSVVSYFLDNYAISSLLGHRGRVVGVDILATFLPHIVVDSLYTVMNKIGLEVMSLTLEPIAAINVTIPRELRLLNLALVDIGAGTSDIALTRDGSVVAYAMAPVAGDEITEKIAQHYLVDFNTAEKIKISFSSKNSNTTFTDILGKKYTVSFDEVMEVVRPSIELLSMTISQKILEYNGKAPNAVFLIGGGSQIVGLSQLIAQQLGLPEERVAVRGRDIIQNIIYTGKKLSGPEAITPFGIAVTAQLQKGQDFLTVAINGKKVRLFNSKKLTIADALILIGFNPDQLIGRTGKGITFELNGIKKIIRGEYGKAAEIYVNDKPGSLDAVLNVGDDIRIVPAENGHNAEVRVGNFISSINRYKVSINSNILQMGTSISINGKAAYLDSEIKDGDKVNIEEIKTLGDVLKLCEMDFYAADILVNGKAAGESFVLENNDFIEINQIKDEPDRNEPEQKEFLNFEDFGETPGDKAAEIADEDADMLTSLPLQDIVRPTVNINGRTVALNEEKKYIFVDMFNYTDFDLSRPQGSVVLKLNGQKAGFTDEIKSGDVIEIYWEK